MAYIFYTRELRISNTLKNIFPNTYKFILNKLYIDEIYDALIVKPILILSNRIRQFDHSIYDKYGVNLIAGVIFRFSRLTSKIQNGYVNLYAVIMVLGLFIILTYYYFLYWGFK
jgi:NADH-quinone oxidoreductase subunit L